MIIHTKDELRQILAEAQRRRDERLAFTVAHALAASLSDAQFRSMLDLLLPMAQGRSIRLLRERSGDWQAVIHLRYRAGVRIADAYRRGDLSGLFHDERRALDEALSVVAAACQDEPDELVLARRLLDAVHTRAAYENPPVGSPGYPRVVSAVSVLVGGRGNCQGFSDAYYLLGSLAGLTVGYQAGFKGRTAHLWNTLRLDGARLFADATSGVLLPDETACAALGLSWEGL